MNFFQIVPEWNIKKEADDLCQLCKISVPAILHFIEPVFIADRYMDLCPKCARELRNLLLGYPARAMYPGDEANRMYNKFISWLVQEGKE